MRNRSSMPQAKVDRPMTGKFQFELSPQALSHWNASLMASAPTDNSISVLDAIGVDPWTGEGVTAKRISAALRSIGAEKDVIVNINSPGGDLFEGMAIYNMLREHKGSVQVKVLGVAASAASIIAMAGDDIQIARAGFLMIHDTWVLAIGNRNDLRAAADMLEPFDAAMADIYSMRSGIDQKKIQKMMDAETWINGSAAVDQGFADSLLASDAVKQNASAKAERAAAYRIDAIMAKAGVPRSERRALIQECKTGTPSAADPIGMPGATERNDDTPGAVVEGTPSAAVLTALQSFSLHQSKEHQT